MAEKCRERERAFKGLSHLIMGSAGVIVLLFIEFISSALLKEIKSNFSRKSVPVTFSHYRIVVNEKRDLKSFLFHANMCRTPHRRDYVEQIIIFFS
jgi:hypothetical protein